MPLLWLRAFAGGYSVGYCPGALRHVQAAVKQVAEFLMPLGVVVFGAELVVRGEGFVLPVDVGPVILTAEPGSSLARSSHGDVDRCAALDISRLPDFASVPLAGYRPTVIRLSPRLRTVPDSACTCWPLVVLDLHEHLELTEIGQWAFRQTWALRSVRVPASLRRVGRGAFFDSGLREFDASSASPVVGDGAFWDCVRLESARFRGAHWEGKVFCNCVRLSEVYAASVVSVQPDALIGSSVRRVLRLSGCVLLSGQLEAALHARWPVRAAAPPTTVHLSTNGALELVSMTALVVTHSGGSLVGGSQVWLASVDLSGLTSLPGNLRLSDSLFLETVVLPTRL
jgi:hypothetical protein